MRHPRQSNYLAVMVTAALVSIFHLVGTAIALAAGPEPLGSWNDGPGKRAIVDFVGRVTTAGGPEFVPPAERIAVFDNDGTLWSEQPMYFQLAFALDRVRAMAPTHPDWKTTQPFKGVLEGNMKAALAGGERSVMA